MATVEKRTAAARAGRAAPGGGSLREAQKQFTYHRLLDAALDVFASDGYGQARVEDVAARAGASRATFYLHFTGKSGLTHALIDERGPSEDAVWAAVPAGGAPVRAWLDELTGLWERQASYLLALEQAVAVDPTIALRHATQRRARVALVTERRLGGPIDGVVDVRALLLVAQLERFCHLWLVREPGVDWQVALDELAAAWSVPHSA
jgi:AcrR family transcriptional regulator